MGLCKCPKRKVTNLFCFEHRVNVCEHCLVANHPKCIVKSYLQWLQDSDYSTKCTLCNNQLEDNEVVRLICYDVFHWMCLNDYAKQLPSHTAPAGYTCPSCNTGVFPPSNMVSPVAQSLREMLSKVNWARAGLGLPLIEEPHSHHSEPNGHAHIEELHYHSQDQSTPISETVVPVSSSSSEVATHRSMLGQSSGVQPRAVSSSSSSTNTDVGKTHTRTDIPAQAPHKRYDSNKDDEETIVDIIHDHDEDKYKRRSALHWFARWFKSRTSKSRQVDSSSPMKRFAIIFIFGVIAFFTLVVIFTQVGRSSANADPFLDPMANPNIRIGRGSRL
ncbi:zinc finger protein-like 1 homolog [Amphiura filiformis]|uniref:zinc finger protein-like 1 homolog n=1 Tax=Amphiura filiformis TaxID=82378 RepID=UPI003B22327C